MERTQEATAVSEPPSGTIADVDPVAARLVAALEQLRRVAVRMWDDLEGDVEVTPMHAHALETIAAGSRQVSSVADACGRHVSSTSRLVDTLVARGLVDRVPDPNDRRAVRLTVTAAGEAAMARIKSAHAEALSRIVAELGQADACELSRLIERLAAAADRTQR